MASVIKFDQWQTSAGVAVGTILQVKRTFTNTPGSMAAGDWTNITGLSVSITPTSTSSKILLIARPFGESAGQDEHAIHFCIARSGTQLNLGQAAGSRIAIMHAGMSAYNAPDQDSTPTSPSFFTYDSPNTTTALTYTVQIKNQGNGAFTWYYNRTVSDSDVGSIERGSSEIIAMEIAV